MASPQTENGYTPIAHELLDMIVKYPFKGYEFKIVLKIIRDTYGWQSKKRQISYGKMSERTGIDRRHIVNYCASLIARNIILKQKLKNNKNLWGINKDYEEWLTLDGVNFKEREIKKEIERTSEWRTIWAKNNFPPLADILLSEIRKLLKTYSEKNFIRALKISVKQNNKKLAYIEGILKRMESGEGDATNRTQISDGRWMSDKELADAETAGEIYYKEDKWLTKK